MRPNAANLLPDSPLRRFGVPIGVLAASALLAGCTTVSVNSGAAAEATPSTQSSTPPENKIIHIPAPRPLKSPIVRVLVRGDNTKGDRVDRVKNLKHDLDLIGCRDTRPGHHMAQLNSSSLFDGATEAAVMQLQENRGNLGVDGVPGRKTLPVLAKLVAAYKADPTPANADCGIG